jgi:hypothetical protein
VYLLVFHAYINEIHGSRSKIPSKKHRPYIYDVKFLALLGAPYIYDISRLGLKDVNRLIAIVTFALEFDPFTNSIYSLNTSLNLNLLLT